MTLRIVLYLSLIYLAYGRPSETSTIPGPPPPSELAKMARFIVHNVGKYFIYLPKKNIQYLIGTTN